MALILKRWAGIPRTHVLDEAHRAFGILAAAMGLPVDAKTAPQVLRLNLLSQADAPGKRPGG